MRSALAGVQAAAAAATTAAAARRTGTGPARAFSRSAAVLQHAGGAARLGLGAAPSRLLALARRGQLGGGIVAEPTAGCNSGASLVARASAGRRGGGGGGSDVGAAGSGAAVLPSASLAAAAAVMAAGGGGATLADKLAALGPGLPRGDYPPGALDGAPLGALDLALTQTTLEKGDTWLEGPILAMMNYAHGTLGLEWWVAVVGVTTLFRLVTVPAYYGGIATGARLQQHQGTMVALMTRMKQAQGDREAMMRLQGERSAYVRRHKVQMWRMFLPLALQLPVFVSLFGACRKLAAEGHLYPGLLTGGTAWFPHLHAPDPLGITGFGLPVISALLSSVSVLLNNNVQVIDGGRKGAGAVDGLDREPETSSGPVAATFCALTALPRTRAYAAHAALSPHPPSFLPLSLAGLPRGGPDGGRPAAAVSDGHRVFLAGDDDAARDGAAVHRDDVRQHGAAAGAAAQQGLPAVAGAPRGLAAVGRAPGGDAEACVGGVAAAVAAGRGWGAVSRRPALVAAAAGARAHNAAPHLSHSLPLSLLLTPPPRPLQAATA
jgi:hypothetical protein